MSHFDHATALALGLDRWAEPKPMKTHELELMHRTHFEQGRRTGPVSGNRPGRRRWFGTFRPGFLSKFLYL